MDAPTSLYVVEQGGQLHRIGGRLIVRTARGRVLQDVPLWRLERVLLFGAVEVTREAFLHLEKEGIDLVYLTREGRFRARTHPLRLQDAQTRLAQYALANDPARRLSLAREIVSAKIRNGLVLLRRRLDAEAPVCPSPLSHLRMLAEQARAASSTEALMGIEGTAARIHFSLFSALLKQDFGFFGRQRRPPPDPVNGMLSFGYTLLHGYVLSAVCSAALDPYLGVLHELRKGRASLPLDLMEELRPIVDGVVLGLVNRVEMTPTDFEQSAEGGIRMTDRALAKFVAAFHKRLAETVHHPASGRTVDYREFARLQALSYRNWVLGAGAYQPLQWR